jgi:hypothetical protein
MGSIVVSVENTSIGLPTAGPTSVGLGASQTIADCVPFISYSCNNDTVRDRCAEVYFSSGPNIVGARATINGRVDVEASVVEFDTSGNISVEQGTFTITAGNASVTVTLGGSVDVLDQNKAFIYATYQSDRNSTNLGSEFVRWEWNGASTTQILFTKGSTAGGITGRYYVVWTTGTEFAVEHTQISPASNGTDDNSASFTAVDMAKSFVITSHSTGEGQNDPRDGHHVGDLDSTTTTRARRAFNDLGGSPGSPNATNIINIQVVTAGSDEFSVQRGDINWGDSVTGTGSISTAVTIADSTVMAGGMHGTMTNTDTNEASGAHADLVMSTTTQVTGTRGVNSSVDGAIYFEVIEWNLAAVDPSENAEGFLPGEHQPIIEPFEMVPH